MKLQRILFVVSFKGQKSFYSNVSFTSATEHENVIHLNFKVKFALSLLRILLSGTFIKKYVPSVECGTTLLTDITQLIYPDVSDIINPECKVEGVAFLYFL